MAELKTCFTDFIRNISLSEEQKKELQSAKDDLMDKLAKEPKIKDEYVTTFLQGSYRRSTALKPAKGNASDVDVVLVTTADCKKEKPGEILNRYYDIADSYYPGCCKKQGRSIGIDLGNVTMDLVVTAISDSKGQNLKSLSEKYSHDATLEELLESVNSASGSDVPYDKDDPLMLPDRKIVKWEKTHPIAQVKWTSDKNARCNGYYLAVVKALKWWHKVMYPNQEKPNSYPLEHFIGDCCPNSINSVAEGVMKTFDAMRKVYSKPCLPDRGVPEHDVFAKVSAEEYEAFNEAVQKAYEVAIDAYNIEDAHESALIWRKLFGDEFPVPPQEPHVTKRKEQTTAVPRNNFA